MSSINIFRKGVNIIYCDNNNKIRKLFSLSYFKKSFSKYSNSKNINTTFLTYEKYNEKYNEKLKKFATVSEGYNYENEVYRKLVQIFGKNNIKREKNISLILHSFKKSIEKTKLLGIDFTIETKYKDTKVLYAIQIKIGAGKRNYKDVIPFIRTVQILRQFVKHNKKHSFHNSKIIPLWLSSAKLTDNAKKNLIKNFIHYHIVSEWSSNIEKCELFTNFLKKITQSEQKEKCCSSGATNKSNYLCGDILAQCHSPLTTQKFSRPLQLKCQLQSV